MYSLKTKKAVTKQMEMKYQSLISKMSLREKVSLLSGKNFWETMDLPKYGIPSVFISDGPNGLRKQAASADHLGLNPSIPATCFPTSATIANSWDPEIARLAGRNIGEEAAAAKVSVLLAPGINIKRNPRCGRNFEYYSEDPYLAGKLAASYIEGVQSNGIISCVKHFACNNQEMGRMASNSIVDERTLREIYLTAFEMAVKEGRVGAVMSAYNRVNDVYCNENNHLLREILRGEWGFGGFIITDWGGENDRVKGLQAGNDLEMPSTQGETNQVVKEAVEKGIIPESLVDEALDRILTAFFATTEALAKASRSFDKAAHHRAALKAAQESIVLLKNEDGILPLKPKTKVAVIGDFAQNPRYQGAGSSIVNPLKLDSVLDLIGGYGLDYIGYEPGFKRYGGDSGKLIKKAMDLGDEADVILLFIGLDEVTESEGIDRKDLRLPTNQLDLIDALYDTGKPIVAVLSCGSVVELPFIDRLAALVHAYLPGEAGAGAILDVLTGKVNPSGKLAETYPFGYPDVPSADHFGLQDFSVQYRESVFVGYR
jgi:beta-glucosidase